jgi:hypothetical protein
MPAEAALGCALRDDSEIRGRSVPSPEMPGFQVELSSKVSTSRLLREDRAPGKYLLKAPLQLKTVQVTIL